MTPWPMAEPGELPNLEDVFVLVRDEAKNITGLQPLEGKLDAAAEGADEDLVLSVLESGKALDEIILSIFLSLRITRKYPHMSARAEKALLHHVTDHRVHETKIQGEKQVFDLAACAFNAYFELIRRRAPDVLAVLAVLDMSLMNPRRMDLTSATVHLFNHWFHKESRFQSAAEQVSELLADAVEDVELHPLTRVRAYEAILSGSRFGPTPRTTDPVAKAVFGAQRARAGKALVKALEDPKSRPELRQYILFYLHSISPDSIEALREKGLVPKGELPPPEQIISFEWRSADPDTSSLTALAIKHEQLLTALTGLKEDEPRLLSAVLLAPFFSKRGDWKPLAGALLKLIASDKAFTLTRGKASCELRLDREASISLLNLLKGVPEDQETGATDWLFRALDACLSKEVPCAGCASAPVMDYLYELGSRENKTGGRLKASMRALIGAPGRPAMARFAAFYYYRFLDREVEVLARKAAADPNEDPDFVGLLKPLL